MAFFGSYISCFGSFQYISLNQHQTKVLLERKSGNMKKIIVRGSAITLISLGAIYLVVCYVVYDKLSKVTPGGGVDAQNTPASFKMTVDEWPNFNVSPYFIADYEKVRFPSRQAGLNLAGWYIPGDPGSPVVILTHGLNGCKCSPRILTIAGMLHRNGFNVLLYDMREHGESDIEDGRAAIGNEEYQDLLGAWDWLVNEKNYEPKRIGVFGESLGAGTTLIAFGQEPRIAAAFVDSPYSDLPEIINEELARNNYPTFLEPGAIFVARVVAGDNLVAFSPKDAITRDAGRPIFIVHGTADERINVHHTRQLAELATQTGANVTVWIPEGVGHVMAEFALPDEYELRLVTFFRDALGH
jgi:dipeptidyl aminopeptidase/acylaminoacyl peptidase